MKKTGSLRLVLLFLLLGPTAVEAEPISGVWIAAIGASQYGIKFLEEGPGYCGILYWLSEPRTVDGQWKLDTKNPAADLQPRRLLGLTLLGRLKRSSPTVLKGRIYIPDPDVPGIGGIPCDVTITFNAASRPISAQARLEGPLLSKCQLVGAAKNPLQIGLSTTTLQGPTADDARCNYNE